MRLRVLIKFTAKILAFCICYAAFLSITVAQMDWVQVVSEDGKFAVLMPDRPKKIELPLVLGEFRAVAHTATTRFDGVTFSVSYSDLAIDPNDTSVAVKILDEADQSATGESKAKVLRKTNIELDGSPGRELFLDLGNDMVLSRTYLVKNRLYQLVATISKTPVGKVQVIAFFNSFAIGDNAAKSDHADGDKVFVPPPPPPPPPSPCSSTAGPAPRYVRRSEGVIRGSAIHLVTPSYPVDAREARVEGKVEIDIVIDEQGNVEDATARSGDQLLRDACINAARASKFKPTLLCGTPLKVEGTLTYNFTLR